MTGGQVLALVGIAALRGLFARSAARRTLDAMTGAALLGLGARLALTSAR